MTKLYLTHPNFNFNRINPRSILLDQTISKIEHNEYHTSLGDLSPTDILQRIDHFDSVEFIGAGFEQDLALKKETEQLVRFLQTKKLAAGLELPTAQSFTDHPELNTEYPDKTLWIFGCSHSHGVGLDSQQDSYGPILSTKMSMPLKLITKPGSSLHWSLRHLMNAPINSNDLVVWQLTSPLRLSYFNGKRVEEILLARSTHKHLLETYNDFQSYFMHLSLVNIGVKFLHRTGAKFILISVDIHDAGMQYEYSKYHEYFFPQGFNVDHGNDGLHFGPLSHKNLANALANRIQLLNV